MEVQVVTFHYGDDLHERSRWDLLVLPVRVVELHFVVQACSKS